MVNTHITPEIANKFFSHSDTKTVAVHTAEQTAQALV
jgi:hypothetical protein